MTWSARPAEPSGHLFSSSEMKIILDEIEGLWADWTPTLTNLTQGNGTVLARYVQMGSTVHWRFRFTLGSTSAVGTAPKFDLPVTPADYSNFIMGDADLTDSGVANRRGTARWTTGSTVEILNYTPATGVAATTTATVPFTWGTADSISASGTYEAA